MNHCRKCDSDYAAPGTCNCFAPPSVDVAKRDAGIIERMREIAAENERARAAAPKSWIMNPAPRATHVPDLSGAMVWTGTASAGGNC